MASEILLTLLRDTLRRYAQLVVVTLRPRRGAYAGRTLRHYALGSIALLLLPMLLAYHWLGLLLHELLFPGYRRVPVERPVFILGLPRSGTTALHETLAEDPQFTTFRAWECLFAVSVSWRKLWLAVAGLDRRVFNGLAALHPMTLRSPEEDYFAFCRCCTASFWSCPFRMPSGCGASPASIPTLMRGSGVVSWPITGAASSATSMSTARAGGSCRKTPRLRR